jgi:hypothetical protein
MQGFSSGTDKVPQTGKAMSPTQPLCPMSTSDFCNADIPSVNKLAIKTAKGLHNSPSFTVRKKNRPSIWKLSAQSEKREEVLNRWKLQLPWKRRRLLTNLIIAN